MLFTRTDGGGEMKNTTALIFEKGSPGRLGVNVPSSNLSETEFEMALPSSFRRKELEDFPEVSEPEAVSHYLALSQKNFCPEVQPHYLGSCTMMDNPSANELIAGLSGFTHLHPETPTRLAQGALRMLFELEHLLCEICGMDAFTLLPAAGAHGEFTGTKVIGAAIRSRGEKRNTIIIPVSAHGTNPASAAMSGFKTTEIPAGPEGIIEPATLEKFVDENTAALMLTNPNTFGLFERHIGEIAEILHKKGAYLYCDGANLNAIVGTARPGDMGIDVIQTNMHKTFSTPHGSGGPGAGPLGVKKELARFLPVPRVIQENGRFTFLHSSPDSIGRIHSFFGNFLVLLRAYAYIRSMGAQGLRDASEAAVLNANYIRAALAPHYHAPFPGPCMHECLLSDYLWHKHKGDITAGDIGKRLLDFGMYPPTIAFPHLPLGDAILTEPTQSKTKETLDKFIAAMKEIAREAKENPELLHQAPHNTPIRRLDEVDANRHPNLRWKEKGGVDK
jgi:glycine dehydrogenase subunit 2